MLVSKCLCLPCHCTNTVRAGKYARQLEAVDAEVDATREALERAGDAEALQQFEEDAEDGLHYGRVSMLVQCGACVVALR